MKAARSTLAVAMSWLSVALLAAGAVAQAADLFTVTTTEPLFAFAGSGVQVFAWSQETVYLTPMAVPTLSAWGTLALAGLLALLTMSSLRRRRRSEVSGRSAGPT